MGQWGLPCGEIILEGRPNHGEKKSSKETYPFSSFHALVVSCAMSYCIMAGALR